MKAALTATQEAPSASRAPLEFVGHYPGAAAQHRQRVVRDQRAGVRSKALLHPHGQAISEAPIDSAPKPLGLEYRSNNTARPLPSTPR